MDECIVPDKHTQSNGYTRYHIDGVLDMGHRHAYREAYGEIPEGLVIDHLCKNRSCVNPLHLEAVTQQENLMRSPGTLAARNAAKTHCKRGHEFTPENTYIHPKRGSRLCRACQKAADARYRESRRPPTASTT